MIIVDGAHAVGQIDVDIEKLAPDFYFTNFHKWAFAPRGAAVLSIKKELVSLIHPNIINNQYGNVFCSLKKNLGNLKRIFLARNIRLN